MRGLRHCVPFCRSGGTGPGQRVCQRGLNYFEGFGCRGDARGTMRPARVSCQRDDDAGSFVIEEIRGTPSRRRGEAGNVTRSKRQAESRLIKAGQTKFLFMHEVCRDNLQSSGGCRGWETRGKHCVFAKRTQVNLLYNLLNIRILNNNIRFWKGPKRTQTNPNLADAVGVRFEPGGDCCNFMRRFLLHAKSRQSSPRRCRARLSMRTLRLAIFQRAATAERARRRSIPGQPRARPRGGEFQETARRHRQAGRVRQSV